MVSTRLLCNPYNIVNFYSVIVQPKQRLNNWAFGARDGIKVTYLALLSLLVKTEGSISVWPIVSTFHSLFQSPSN